jgi:hypothetical protein
MAARMCKVSEFRRFLAEFSDTLMGSRNKFSDSQNVMEAGGNVVNIESIWLLKISEDATLVTQRKICKQIILGPHYARQRSNEIEILVHTSQPPILIDTNRYNKPKTYHT